MVSPLDVFAVSNDEPKWLGWAETLTQAVELLRKAGSGSYFVFSQETGHKNLYEVSTDGVVTSVRFGGETISGQ